MWGAPKRTKMDEAREVLHDVVLAHVPVSYLDNFKVVYSKLFFPIRISCIVKPTNQAKTVTYTMYMTCIGGYEKQVHVYSVYIMI